MVGHLPRGWEMERGSRPGGLEGGGVASWGNGVSFECVCVYLQAMCKEANTFYARTANRGFENGFLFTTLK
jgi:hypothetical protein